MKIGYLMNTYPITSTTFIRREIAAHEAAGASVHRYAIRSWDGPLVDPADRAEAERTTYLLDGQLPRVAVAALREAAVNPRGLWRAARLMLRLRRRAAGAAGAGAAATAVRHVAYLLEAIRFRQLAARDGIGHVHAHFSTNSAAVALLAQAMGGPGYSFTVHGPDELIDPTANALDDKVAGARFVVAISDYCQGVVRRESAPEQAGKVHVVRCGIELSEFDGAGTAPVEAAPAARAGSTEDGTPLPRSLVCVGRLCPQKAQTLLVEAAAALRAAHPDLRIVLIGDGETRPEIEAGIARHGIAPMIELRGWGTNEEVRAALREARALVLPSLAEGLPVVIMEALAMRRPVISTRITGIPELVDASCGWIVPPGDAGALAEAIAACLDAPDDALRAMGREGLARVRAMHDQSANAAALRELIAAHDPLRLDLPRTRAA